MAMSPAGLAPENDCAGDVQQQLPSRQRGSYIRGMTARVQLSLKGLDTKTDWPTDRRS
jgi:hypothetical protein